MVTLNRVHSLDANYPLLGYFPHTVTYPRDGAIFDLAIVSGQFPLLAPHLQQ